MTFLRGRLSYANVTSTIAIVLALGGATAFAASHLAKNSVGPRQLKRNAVTSAKIKGGAVTTAKLADGSVTAGKLGSGLVQPASAQVVQRLLGTQSVPFPTTATTVNYFLDNPTFVQPPGEDDLLIGAITARFSPACKSPREFTAMLQEEDPMALGGARSIAFARGQDENGTGEATLMAQFGAIQFGAPTLLAPSKPTPHTYSIRLERIFCATGSQAGATATATGAQVDVVGIR